MGVYFVPTADERISPLFIPLLKIISLKIIIQIDKISNACCKCGPQMLHKSRAVEDLADSLALARSRMCKDRAQATQVERMAGQIPQGHQNMSCFQIVICNIIYLLGYIKEDTGTKSPCENKAIIADNMRESSRGILAFEKSIQSELWWT